MVRVLSILIAAMLVQACAATKVVTAPVKLVTGTVDTAVDIVD